MNEKVKVTELQKKRIDDLESTNQKERTIERLIDNEFENYWLNDYYSVLKDMDGRQLLKALTIGYEVEPEFSLGDKVIRNHVGDTYGMTDDEISEITEMDGRWVNLQGKGYVSHDALKKYFRHATESEKQRRWWAKHGREVWELREDDVLDFEGATYTVDRLKDFDGKVVIFTDDSWEYFDNVEELYNVVCFAEQRLDRSETNE